MTSAVRLLIITGLSGAGKTLTVKSLEDLGFFCVDNIPPALIPKFGELLAGMSGQLTKVALVCDLRGGELFSSLFTALSQLEEESGIPYQILFLEANDDTLVRRYKETRSRHPLAREGGVLEGITRERRMLDEIRGRADVILNTSQLKPTELKSVIAERFGNLDARMMTIRIVSFGFKYGVPIDADLIFDVRFLPNPYYIESMRSKTGQDAEVYDYVLKWPVTKQFVDKLTDMIDFLLPQFDKEGKAQVIVGIGCTGGQHRSVALAETLAQHLRVRETVHIVHRDMSRSFENPLQRER